MQTEFPEQPGYSGFFALGFDKQGGNTRRTGIVVVKRTYTIASGGLTPVAENPLPIFLKDMPDNRVANSDFTGLIELPSPDDPGKQVPWLPDASVTISILDPESATARLQVTKTSAGEGRVVQTIAFDEPLGGSRFQLSFSVRGETGNEAISNVQLEADADDGSVITICSLSRNNLPIGGTRMTSAGQTAAQTTFPADLTATEMRLVLRGPNTIDQVIEYDQVQVEQRTNVTVWNAMTTLRYENDLAPIKPFVDIIVLGNTATAGNAWRVHVTPFGGAPLIWLQRTNPPFDQKAMFGWQPKDDGNGAGHRQPDAGTFSSDPNTLPPQWPNPAPGRNPLPDNFSNTFYCGQLRSFMPSVTIAQQQAPPLDSRARIRVEIDTGVSTNYEFQLRGDAPTAALDTYSGSGEDQESAWQRTAIAMLLDTLVIEPERDQCYLVWRGAWDFDAFAEGNYRRLAVAAG